MDDDVKKVKLLLKGLSCANCANKIESKVSNINGIKEATVNFATSTLIAEVFVNHNKEEIINQIKDIVKSIEKDVIVEEVKGNIKRPARTISRCEDGCCTINNHSDNYTNDKTVNKSNRILLKGLTCANCANKIEAKVKNLDSIKYANINFATTTLLVELNKGYKIEEAFKEINKIVKSLEPDVEVELQETSKKGKRNRTILSDASSSNEVVCEKEKKTTMSYVKENIFLVIGTLGFVLAVMLESYPLIAFIFFAATYLIIGKNVLITAAKNILRGEVFDENFLMAIATLGAFAIGEYPEAVAVMLFFEIGEAFQKYAVERSRKSISSLMNIRADYATVLENGNEIRVDPEDVEIDEIIIIKPGERVPLDGIVVDGTSFIDTSALTGESVPREITVDTEILAGAINNTGVLKVRVTKEYGESTVARILELVENASNKKALTEKFITKFSKIYTPVVCLIALLVAVVPPLIMKDQTFSVWIYRALSLLVVSCPCALVVSVPLGIFAGIGGASKKGVLVKGGNYLEALKDVETVVFDKTGTLTKGVFKVTEINTNNIDKDELLKLAAYGESNSNHPIALSIVKAYGKEINKESLINYEEISGHGIKVNIEGNEVLLGNYKLMNKFNIKFNEVDTIGTIVHVAINGKYKGNIVISDEIKETSKEAIETLKSIGIKNTVMLTGDNKVVADKVGKIIGLDQVYSELLPADKVEQVEKLMNIKSSKGKLVFVGDGINDAPVLARADIGIAMGGIGSDAAIEAADVVLMKDDPKSIVDAIKAARKTNKILWQNIIFALAVKTIVMILVAFGIGTMWEAVFADVGVTILAVINSIRCLR
ncbi:heavy metal translocating P-type ATPase [Clostridium disporicum]|uniref:Cadmium, zinc and cobalt-transporting ATPase CadA n=1 Tax=Clostridium disporicum TaxID=84024 RepID=A0A174HNQ0_9CLOT|nr:heavy metal translocating P-type ATPase [Clostridium disporicum]CUO76582.1 cadmium%2C zinc and cobalt-transporting ATPase CadA [Clostridium disporicum]